ncbi:hypothetical protein H0H81_008489 [Sphagnurus paluster]|uniref:Uncharacterized protein n=1 Tax=Sphagnurus paluster TaxID=117069 RepID=A0A9P7GIX2_9AGAR|nr:hypothetical protein H0H81_008489 [Sphagnurus paluster]
MLKRHAWHAQRTLSETEAILTAPGSLHELETRLIDGRLQRVYKRMWPSLRALWLWSATQYGGGDLVYAVFEGQRMSYKRAFERSLRAAGVYRDVYGVRKERAELLEGSVDKLKADAGRTGILVLHAHEGKGTWSGMQSWDAALDAYRGDTRAIETGKGIDIELEDDATILFTSGALTRPVISSVLLRG